MYTCKGQFIIWPGFKISEGTDETQWQTVVIWIAGYEELTNRILVGRIGMHTKSWYSSTEMKCLLFIYQMCHFGTNKWNLLQTTVFF